MSTVITAVIPSRTYLSELVDRLNTITRSMESEGNAWGREEAESIVDAMGKRASQLRDSLRVRERNTSLSLDALRGRLSAMSLCSILADYDKAATACQNVVGDQVHAHECATGMPDSRGRDALDRLEASHWRLEVVMREIAGAETDKASRQ
jgi:hypothetical protein